MAQIDPLLKQMVQCKASDLHLCCGVPPIMRQYGKIKPVNDKPNTQEFLQTALQEVMPEHNYQEFCENGDTDFGYELPGCGRFRANAYMDRNGIGCVFRVIPEKIMTAEDLKLPESVTNLCYLSKGLVLVTGPTGSGKSTTLAALIDLVNRNRQDHVITIEDPIEFVYRNQRCLINQREVNTHTRSFKTALRAALREDPDVILVGELRDLESIEIALETAETGHLVFATLHTNTAAATIDRLIDQFPANQQPQIRMMLSSTLKGVIAQVLLPRIDGNGMVAAFEILIVNQAVTTNIREGKTYQIDMAISTGKRHGMRSLSESLIELINHKVITVDDAYMAATDKENFMRELERLGVRFNPATLGMKIGKPSELQTFSSSKNLPAMNSRIPPHPKAFSPSAISATSAKPNVKPNNDPNIPNSKI